MEVQEFVLVQDRTTKMFFVGFADAVKSKENLQILGKYTDPSKAMDDLVAYSTGRKAGTMPARLNLKDIAKEMVEDEDT
jgi:hypothetical protein